MNKPALSIIIVNFNTKKLLQNLLSSLMSSNFGSYSIEAIIIDNHSHDGSGEMLKKFNSTNRQISLQKIYHQTNLGFGRANNRGAQKAKSDWLLFINSDTLLLPETLRKVIDYLKKNPRWAALTCKVELRNGQLDPACHRGFPTPWAALTYFSGLEKLFPRSKILAQYHQLWKNIDQIHEIDVISGAFFVIKKEIFINLGMFDEEYFMYGEDIDLCYRLRKNGYNICFFPETKIIHFKRQSGRGLISNNKITHQQKAIQKSTRHQFYQTMQLFYDKNYQHQYPMLLRQLVILGILIISKIRK